jgi:TetR/AcrR family transcriptional regulator, transcriptional repressor for nem operon
MARPRSFSSEQVVEAAQGVFWCSGYQQAAIRDLERATRLSRSSLYGAFGTKKAIFDQALDAYLADFIGSRLAPLERPGAGTGDIERFLAGLAAFFRTDERAQQGCLMINSIAEHEGRSDHLAGRAQAFRDRLHHALSNALASHQPTLATERAHLLTATTFGIWLTARIDPATAADACEATIASVRTWRRPAPRRRRLA